jgi:hypothetical protein
LRIDPALNGWTPEKPIDGESCRLRIAFVVFLL